MRRIAFVAVLAAILVLGIAGLAAAQAVGPAYGTQYGFYENFAYEGSDLCGSGCHGGPFSQWSESGHADVAAQQHPIDNGGNCASCHSTNFEPANTVFDDGHTGDEATQPGQGCEACHGPGHWSATGTTNTAVVEADGDVVIGGNPATAQEVIINRDVTLADVRKSQTCGQCHDRHSENYRFLPDTGVEYPLGYLPGTELTDFVHIPAPEGFPGFRDEPAQPTGFDTQYFWKDFPSWSVYSHGGSGVEYQEFRQSVHGVIGLECVTCHDPHSTGLKASDSFALCAQCHTGSNLTVGQQPRSPQVSMLKGEGGVGVASVPHVHSAYCVQCHMVPTGYGHDGTAGTGPNHLWKIVMPQEAASLTTTIPNPDYDPADPTSPEEIQAHMPNSSCSPCHGSPGDPLVESFQSIIDQRQNDTQTELDALNQLLVQNNSNLSPADKELWNKARYNIRFVQADGSKGFHNYPYASQLLYQARQWLEQIEGGAQPPSFPDVQSSDYFYEAVVNLAEMGVVGGYEDGTFGPYDNLLRAQFSKMIVELTGNHTATIDNLNDPTFSDVTQVGLYPYDYVEEAHSEGFINGFDDGTFRPYAPITRGQIALILYRAAGSPDVSGITLPFTDVSGLSAEAQAAIAYAYDNGIVSGFTDDTFRPYDNATRGQAAKMMWNFYQLEYAPLG